MRINHEMTTMRQKVREKAIDGFGFTSAPGTFMLNGNQLSRSSVQNCSSHETDKLYLCGTCGSLLSNNRVVHCESCKQMKVSDKSFIGTLADDWRRRKVSIQFQPPEHERRPVRRVDLTDDASTVTSGDRSYWENCEREYLETRLSMSESREPSTRRLPKIAAADDKYKKFLSGFGMQEPNEKVYSQAERLWLPSRVGLVRSKAIVDGKVTVNSPIKGQALRQHGPQDKPHFVPRSNSSKTMRT